MAVLSVGLASTGSAYYYYVHYTGRSAPFNPIFVDSLGTAFRTHSLFFNDNLRYGDHFTFNLGVRWDKNHGADAGGNLVAKDSAFSPRLGVVIDPAGLDESVDGYHEEKVPFYGGLSRMVNRNDAAVIATGVGGTVVYRNGQFCEGYGTTLKSGRFLGAGAGQTAKALA